MLRRLPKVVAPLLFALFLLGMGATGKTPQSDSIPRPKENYQAELSDRQGLVTHVELLSCAGKTFFPLQRGEGTLMVPFAKVSRLTVGPETGAHATVTVAMRDGSSLNGALPPTLLCTGVTGHGNFRIEIRGLEKIAFETR